jgi:hypothetical protein
MERFSLTLRLPTELAADVESMVMIANYTSLAFIKAPATTFIEFAPPKLKDQDWQWRTEAVMLPQMIDTELLGKFKAAINRVVADGTVANKMLSLPNGRAYCDKASKVARTAESTVTNLPIFTAKIESLITHREDKSQHIDLLASLGDLESTLSELASTSGADYVQKLSASALEVFHSRMYDSGILNFVDAIMPFVSNSVSLTEYVESAKAPAPTRLPTWGRPQRSQPSGRIRDTSQMHRQFRHPPRAPRYIADAAE